MRPIHSRCVCVCVGLWPVARSRTDTHARASAWKRPTRTVPGVHGPSRERDFHGERGGGERARGFRRTAITLRFPSGMASARHFLHRAANIFGARRTCAPSHSSSHAFSWPKKMACSPSARTCDCALSRYRSPSECCEGRSCASAVAIAWQLLPAKRVVTTGCKACDVSGRGARAPGEGGRNHGAHLAEEIGWRPPAHEAGSRVREDQIGRRQTRTK